MNPRNLRRKIYDRKQLNKQAQKNRQITGPIRRKKKNISQEIVQEIEKENNDIEMAEEESKEKAGEDEKSSKSENEPEEKEPKKKIERPKLDEKNLLYNRESGLRKYYEVITNTQFKEKDVTKNLDKLISITRNWHFMLFPKYDFDYFTNKLISLGKQPPTKSFMSRVRRIYKGEFKWDVIYDEQDEILGKANKKNENENENQEQENKDENINNNVNVDNNINNISNNDLEKNKIKNKKEEFDYNDEEQGMIRDLFLKDEIVEDKEKIDEEENNDNNNINNKKDEEFDIKDSDFDNFSQDYNPEEEIIKKENKENKEKILFNGVEIDANEKPDISGINSFKEKRTSMQVEENEKDNINGENNDEMKPQSLNNKIILDK